MTHFIVYLYNIVYTYISYTFIVQLYSIAYLGLGSIKFNRHFGFSQPSFLGIIKYLSRWGFSNSNKKISAIIHISTGILYPITAPNYSTYLNPSTVHTLKKLHTWSNPLANGKSTFLRHHPLFYLFQLQHC
ncbi:hypothetical protein TSAR_012903 [Trichomalopsis sarcophagae]|uniref:Uncharacterized protein n=1 Tax=Trichomalopsis sarcophagae TaxID=543379 RepID=A0A232FGD2_9HYME|nr:hypothetical protein TSAR_012903 [Trichomalopsis sarcophagae]